MASLRNAGLGLALALSLAPLARAEGDPVGGIAGAAPFDGGGGVLVGTDASDRAVCYVRETGDSHRLDIGIGGAGAFVRLEAGDNDPGAVAPQAPLLVYAGQQESEEGKAADRFAILKSYEGTASFLQFAAPQPGWLLSATGDPAPFLEVVAAARRKFLVVESQQPRAVAYVAVYEFTPDAAAKLVACAARHVSAPEPGPHLPRLAPTLPAELW
jgi:hypothetical protein